jgi:hypothetical protein
MPGELTRIELADHFRQEYGPDLVAYLMEVIPPFSWSEIATKTDLRDLEARLHDRIDRRGESITDKLGREFQQQTNRLLMWLLPVVVAAIVGTAALS